LDLCLCSRRERLRQCGNGVVPMTAALAWETLMVRFRGGDSRMRVQT
jgi:hypothetical protein